MAEFLLSHNILSYAKRIDEICLGEWWQFNISEINLHKFISGLELSW